MSTFRKIVEDIVKEGEKKLFDPKTGYNISKDEQYIFEKLKQKYPDVIESYTDDRFVNPNTNRHFQLDFYIPSLDMGMNYNKIITHGRRKFEPNNPLHKKDVIWLKNKKNDFYKRILKQWTITDPIKREVTEKNNIKFIEWFNLDEFERWFNDPTLTYEEYKYAPDSLQYNSAEYFKEKERGRDIYGNDSDYLAP